MNSIIKLTSGETIIAEVAHEDESNTTILEPLSLEIQEGESGRPTMVAFTWIPLLKKVNMVNLKTQHVVAIAEVDDEIDLYYRKSLAILKGDSETLREILREEATEEDIENIREQILQEEEIDDPWMEKFGQPVELSANTVH